ncbi:MAG: hypothetical protein WGN25_13665 [Candidatus Electrothrix sp. GW3-4]|uniref:hypothetical protein n=1 Tax=Candidatus Electrothrix sp. GW3-4 TaxID=3126740 RepID=UPI0030D1BA57
MNQEVNGDRNIVAGRDVNITIQDGKSAPPPLSNKFQLAKLPRTDARLFGREEELNLLDQAWQEEKTKVLVLTAFGGMGKTALMQTWLDAKGYAGADAVYTWSFYSQGTAEDRQASAAEFFASALPWFEHDGSPLPSEHDRGLRLAELVCRQRTLLILDGLEPLQYPLAGAMDGALRDKGILCLCRQLAAQNNGLLLISSRQPVQELVDRPGVEQHELDPLSKAAGVELFRAAGIIGTDKELVAAVNTYNGHALSLNLLATYLCEYENGDIRKQDSLRCLTEFPEETRTSRHAFKVMAAYEQQLSGTADLQVLYSLGLFDRPVSAGTMNCLRESEIEHVGGPNNDKVFHAACRRLRRLGLLNRDDAEHPGTLDCHPLVQQYFGKRLEELHPESWQQAHARLYEYFKALPDKELPDTLEEMELLFAAVRHGCAAEMHHETLHKVYYPRILRNNEDYLCVKIGSTNADLTILSRFFDKLWQVPISTLSNYDRALLISRVGFILQGLGRLNEALPTIQVGLKWYINQDDMINAAIMAGNLSQLYLSIGEVSKAVNAGRQGFEFAVKSNCTSQRIDSLTDLADALHQSGTVYESRDLFVEAEKKQKLEADLLYSMRGIHYCDLLLTAGGWHEVKKRAKKTLGWVKKDGGLLDVALDELSLGRAAVQEAIALSDQLTVFSHLGLAPDLACLSLPGSTIASANRVIEAMRRANDWLNQAVNGLREAGQEDDLPRGLLARAAWHRWAAVLLDQSDITQAVQDLQETEEIAQRGGMKLHLIDFHLEAARLSLTADHDILGRTPAEHLAAAKKGIDETGYNRRLPEVKNIEELL